MRWRAHAGVNPCTTPVHTSANESSIWIMFESAYQMAVSRWALGRWHPGCSMHVPLLSITRHMSLHTQTAWFVRITDKLSFAFEHVCINIRAPDGCVRADANHRDSEYRKIYSGLERAHRVAPM